MEELIRLIERFEPSCDQERRDRKTVLRDLKVRGKALLDRETSAHFTASALVFDPQLEQVLMVHHNLFRTYTWPGGHADGEQDLLSAALREIREETGAQVIWPDTACLLSLDVLGMKAHVKNGKEVPEHVHYSAGFGVIASRRNSVCAKEDENSEVRWIPFDEIESYSGEAHMVRIYRKTAQRMKALREQREKAYAQLPDLLLPWYRDHARTLPWRENRDPYRVWISEIMLQQTRVEAVKGYYGRFLNTFPNVESLAQGREEVLLKLWEGLGYYSRARNLKKTAVILKEQYGGCFPQDVGELRKLPGIGEYTAGAIASICFDLPEPAVDGNVLRVICRLTETWAPVGLPNLKEAVRDHLKPVYPGGKCGLFTQSLMELGAQVCLPNGVPKCGSCPLSGICLAYRTSTAEQLPVREKRRQRRIEEKTVVQMYCGDRLAIEKRTEKGVLQGLWQLPNTDGFLSDEQLSVWLDSFELGDVSFESSVERSHVFTHIEWKMKAYRIRVSMQDKRFVWADRSEIAEKYSLPTAFRQFLEPQC